MRPSYFPFFALFSCLKHILCKSHCVGTCYTGRLFPESQDIFHGKNLKGYSYNNITTDDPVKCYSSCVQDCRCKACQMKDARCELLDEDKTSKNLTDEPGYVHFDVRQTMYNMSSHLIPPGVQCYNGCCRSQPCLNGGTCEEQCSSPKEKFSCICQKGYMGKICEKSYASCMDVMISSKKLPKNGVYKIRLSDNHNIKPVYCAFVSPNQAWSLIESFSFVNNHKFRMAFYQNFSVNKDLPPSWDLFRINPGLMQYFRSKSTLFRATCDFQNRVSLTPDFLIGRLSDVDIIAEKQIGGCIRYMFIDVRGHNCTNCTAATVSKKNDHYHIDVTQMQCSDFNPPYDDTAEIRFSHLDHIGQRYQNKKKHGGGFFNFFENEKQN